MDGLLSSSWPAAVPLHRQKTQPPRAPLRKPCWASWEVPPLVLSPMLEHENEDSWRSRSGSDTTLGEDDDEPLVFTLDEATLDDEDDDDDELRMTTVMSLEDDDDDDIQHPDIFDIQMVGLDEPEEAGVSHPTLSEDNVVRRTQRSQSMDTSPGPLLLSVLAQVATASWTRVPPLSPSSDDHMDGMLSSSWPLATATSRSRLQPPRAPLRRPSAAPWEVMPLLLPMSPAQLSPGVSPRNLSPSGSLTSLGKASAEITAELDEDEHLIFSLDGLESEDADEDEEEFPTQAEYLDLTGFDLDDGRDANAVNNDTVEEATSAPATRKSSSVSLLGASPALELALEQVAAFSQGLCQ